MQVYMVHAFMGVALVPLQSPTRRPLPHASTVDMVSDITRLSSGRPTKGAATLPSKHSFLIWS